MLHVNEYPKSGATWLCRLLAETLDLRFDDNSYPKPGAAVMKHHRLSFKSNPTITIIRDPRDVAVSYFHHISKPFAGDPFNKHSVAIMQKEVFDGKVADPSDNEQLKIFIKKLVTSPVTPSFTWGEFYRHQSRKGVPIIRYEDMRIDAASSLGKVLKEIGADYSEERLLEVIDKHDIKKILAKRKQDGNKEGSFFIRKGEVGGWRERLCEESIALIEKDAGDLLDKYGYR